MRKACDVSLGYSLSDLMDLRRVAEREFPGFAPLIEAYIRFAERSESGATPNLNARPARYGRLAENMHLFDLLREKKLFPANTDLAEFAERILPNMSRYRFDKMSRGDIAARIIDYLETLDKTTRASLEQSMREAMKSDPEKTKRSEQRDFFSKWERIIKGIPL
jgi:hypothetical protein